MGRALSTAGSGYRYMGWVCVYKEGLRDLCVPIGTLCLNVEVKSDEQTVGV